MLDWEFQINGLDEAGTTFETWTERADNMRDPLEKVKELLIAGVRAQFATEGAAKGTPWQPLTTGWEKYKVAHDFYADILRMKKDEPNLFSVATDGASFMIDGTKLEYIVSVFDDDGTEYGSLHQLGVGNLPERPFLVFTDADEEVVSDYFQQWAEEMIDNNFINPGSGKYQRRGPSGQFIPRSA